MGSTTKSDMDRIGLFQEMPYVTIKDPYKEASKFTFNEAAYKNKQMMTRASKERSTGSMAGYFEKDFKMLPGIYVDPISMRRKARMEEKKKNIVTKPFVTMYRARDPEGKGSFFGTLGGPIKDIDPSKPKYREVSKPPAEKANFKVNPAKKGTGYGYPNVGLGKDPPYAYKERTDNYEAALEAQKKDYSQHKTSMKGPVFRLNMHPKEYFDRNPFHEDGKPRRARSADKERSKSAPSDKKLFRFSSPGKKLGGNKDGCFDKFPKRSDKDPYTVNNMFGRVKNEVNKQGKTFYPNKFPKSRPTESVINKNVTVHVTRRNYSQATANYRGFRVPSRPRRASIH